MAKEAKVCRGTWCMAFGFDPPATLDQVLPVLGAWGYDGVELGGFFDHATVERFPDKASRKKLKEHIDSTRPRDRRHRARPLRRPLPAAVGDRLAGGLRRVPRATSRATFSSPPTWRSQACASIPALRGPLPYDADYDEIWDRVVRTFQHHAEKGAEVGCVMLWELESLQPFNKPSETVKMLNDVGHSHFKLMYDTGHFQACGVIGHNHVQPAETLPNQIEFIKMLPPGSIGHIHLCDTDMNTRLNMFGTKCNFGEGIIDFDELMPVLAERYDGVWWAVDSIPMGSKAWSDTWNGLP